MNPYTMQNPFLNPMFGNYGQQPFPQPMQQVGISGKYVNDFGEILASDIPMNSPAIFPKNDRSEIQLREWNSNGQIVTTSYKAMPTEQAPVPVFNTDEVLNPIILKLTELEEKIDKIKPLPRAKKEGE